MILEHFWLVHLAKQKRHFSKVSPKIVFPIGFFSVLHQIGQMGLLGSVRHPRVRRWGALTVVLVFLYFMWPNSQIEMISNRLVTDQRKNEYLDAILNPKDSEAIYQGSDGPVKAIFDPSAADLDTPDVINPERLKMAMDKLNLDSDGKSLSASGSGYDAILSKFVLKSQYSPVAELQGFIGNAPGLNKDYYNDMTCSDISYQSKTDIEFTDPIRIEDDFFEIRDLLLSSKYQNIISVLDESNPEQSIVSDIKNWYKKSGSSVWLPNEQMHLVATTVMYAPFDVFNPLVSFIRLQLFDPDWNEVKGRRIKYSDLSDKDIHSSLKAYTKSKKDEDLDLISIKFPSILNIPVATKNIKRGMGPENPRMLYKNGNVFSEPVIIFNMAESNSQRSMYAVFPLRKPHKENEHSVLRFKNIGKNALIHLKEEKNWVPFFDTIRVGDSQRSRGNIHFLYTMDPLVVFRCSLDSGSCSKLQDNIHSSIYSQHSQAYLRGGSSYHPVPREVIDTLAPANDGKLQMWVGFQKLAIKQSTCSDKFNRPALTLLVKEDGIFRVDLITAPFDFGLKVGEVCDVNSPSIINANGISFWNVDNNNGVYEDHMGLIIDTQTDKVEILFLKNVMNYILGIYSKGNVQAKEFDAEEAVSIRTRKVSECALGNALNYADSLSKKKVAKIVD